MAALDPLPLSVLGGYLGAGKTTLINRLLDADTDRRIAVLVNDFGAIDIDARRIRNRNGRTVALTNGCVCCSIADDLGGALEEVRRAGSDFDQVIIEASGVAQPDRVASYGHSWPGFELGAVVVVADATDVRERVRDKFVGRLVEHQLRNADLLVLAKADLLDPETRRDRLAWLSAFARPQVVVTSTLKEPAVASLVEPLPFRRTVPRPGLTAVELSLHPHFASGLFCRSQSVPLPHVEAWLQGLPPAVVRAKGFVFVREDEAYRYALQAAGSRSSVEREQPWGSAVPCTELVAIWAPAGAVDSNEVFLGLT